jgi:hypothetical protein
MRRVGELLLAGLLLGCSSTPPPAGKAERQNSRHALLKVREAFEERRSWAPAELRARLSLTRYQTKEALRQLVVGGYLNVLGKTRTTVYTLAQAGEADVAAERRASAGCP